MTAPFIEPALTWVDVLRVWHELDVPEGWRPEITREGITMTPPPGLRHNRIASSAYAHGPVATYLLIDAFDEDGPSVTLFSNPAHGAYRNAVRTAFGDKITLPEPTAAVLDTGLFPPGR